MEPENAQGKTVTASATAIVKEVSVDHCGLIVAVMYLSCTAQLDEELSTKTEHIIEKELAEVDKELDRYKMERTQNTKRITSAREEAEVIVEDVERLEQEKQNLLEEIKKKERELDCFKTVHDQLTESQREKEVLQECIKVKENELQEAKAKLQEKEKKLEKYKEKIQKLKKRIEEGVRELGVRDGRIIELEQNKAKAVADLESERLKVRVHFLMPSKSGK